MANKKNRTGRFAVGGVAVAAVLYFLSGSPGLTIGTPFTPASQSTETTIEQSQSNGQHAEEVIVAIDGNIITLNGEAISLDQLSEAALAGQRVVIQSADAKQLTFDSVKKALEDAGAVIIVEE